MNTLHKITLLCTAGALAACSTAPTSFTPAVEGTAQNFGGTYSVTQDGVTLSLPATTGGPYDGMYAWTRVAGPHKGYVYDTTDVLAIAVMDVTTYETIAGINGIASVSVPTHGVGIFAGGYSGSYFRGGAINGVYNVSGALSTNVNFASGAVLGSGTGVDGSSLSITGTVSGKQFNGTATFAGTDYSGAATAPLFGGFYGANTIAGIYQSTDVTGIIWGITP